VRDLRRLRTRRLDDLEARVLARRRRPAGRVGIGLYDLEAGIGRDAVHRWFAQLYSKRSGTAYPDSFRALIDDVLDFRPAA
jgi:hypothetical protein